MPYDMPVNYDLRKPCVGCPFRPEAAPGWLGNYTPEEIVQHIMREIPFLCHVHVEETVGYHGDWLERLGDRAQHCAGALIFARKCAKLPRDLAHAAAVRAIDTSIPILFPPKAFIEHHTKEEKKDEFIRAGCKGKRKTRL